MRAAPPDHWFGRRPMLAAVAGASIIAFSAILVRLADVSPEMTAVFRCANRAGAGGAGRLGSGAAYGAVDLAPSSPEQAGSRCWASPRR